VRVDSTGVDAGTEARAWTRVDAGAGVGVVSLGYGR
jgi:hypothetical protein